MKIYRLNENTCQHHLRTLVEVAQAGSSGVAQPQLAILEAIQKVLFRTDIDLENSIAVSNLGLLEATQAPEERLQLVRLMLIVSLAAGPPTSEQINIIERISQELDVNEPATGVLRHLAHNHRLRFRVGFMRRSHIRNYFANTYRLGGAGAVVKGILVFRGVKKDNQLRARYRDLGDLPVNTLGRCFYEHCVDANIPFPGEKGGFPQGAVYHDFTHVLAGYDTSPEGEMKAAAFQAGYTGGNWDFFTMLFALVIHTAGVNIAPFPMPRLLGRIAQPNLAVEVFHALARGSAINRDLGAGWDFWAYVEEPIEHIRTSLGIEPIDSSLLAT
ncbi:MAG: hypothetical protein GXP16_14835 [Gammaproteobacteria bacterium]|nr:hypothetical protein [Gammaproteobacteria bacterium]